MYSNTEVMIKVIAECRAKGKADWKHIQELLREEYFIDREVNALRSVYMRNREEIDNEIKQIQASGLVEIEEKPKPSADSRKIELLKDGTTVSERKLYLSESQLKSKVSLLEAHGFDPFEFELVSATNNFWDSQTSEGEVLTLYQSKIVVKPLSESKELNYLSIQELLSELKEKDFGKIFKLKEIDLSEKRYALEVDWADIHIGSLSWHEEVGEDNDYKIAFAKIKKIVEEIKYIIRHYNIEKIYHCFLGDTLHIDTGGLTTTAGTQVDFDTRPSKMTMKSYEVIMYIIDETSFVDTEILWVEGNHSKLVEFTVFWGLQLIYRNCEHIKFDVSPKKRKRFVYGDNLIGLLHGDEIKKKEQETWLQYEFREEWGKCKYAEVHSGHFHKEEVTSENGGITRRTNPTIKATDKYEYDHAWISKKAVLCYIWHKEDNLKSIHYLK